MRVVTLPMDLTQSDEIVRELCASVVPLLRAMNPMLDNISDGKIPFLDRQLGTGINGSNLHTDIDPAGLQLYYWGTDAQGDTGLATAYIMLPSWLAKVLKYNEVQIAIPLNPEERITIDFFLSNPNSNHHVRTIFFVNDQWEKLETTRK